VQDRQNIGGNDCAKAKLRNNRNEKKKKKNQNGKNGENKNAGGKKKKTAPRGGSASRNGKNIDRPANCELRGRKKKDKKQAIRPVERAAGKEDDYC